MSWLDTFQKIRATDWSQEPEPEREAKAKEVINIAGYAAAAAVVVPIPFVDLALLLPVHSAMVMTVGHVLGRPIASTEAKRVVLELGAVAGVSVAARAGISALKKLFLPGVGGVIAAPASFAITWGLGMVSLAYFQNPGLSRDELKKIYADAVKEGAKVFSADTFARFRKKHTDADPEAASDAPEAETAEGADAPADGAKSESSPPNKSETLRPKKRNI